jgi:hypothetical protein
MTELAVRNQQSHSFDLGLRDQDAVERVRV